MTIAQKVGWTLGILVATIFAYLILGASMPAITGIVSTANTSLAASANMTNFPGTAEAVNAFPWYVWFIPGGICVAAVVGILRSPTV